MVAYRVLCERLGRAARMSLNIPKIQDGPGDVVVRWRCGCLAAGTDLKRVRLEPCSAHVAIVAEGPSPVARSATAS